MSRLRLSYDEYVELMGLGTIKDDAEFEDALLQKCREIVRRNGWYWARPSDFMDFFCEVPIAYSYCYEAERQ